MWYKTGDVYIGELNTNYERDGEGVIMISELEVLGSSEESLLSTSSVASQSSDINCGPCITENTGAGPDVAIDGNTNGWYSSGSVTHTFYQVDPWLLVSLGLTATVEKLVIWNRTGELIMARANRITQSLAYFLHHNTRLLRRSVDRRES